MSKTKKIFLLPFKNNLKSDRASEIITQKSMDDCYPKTSFTFTPQINSPRSFDSFYHTTQPKNPKISTTTLPIIMPKISDIESNDSFVPQAKGSRAPVKGKDRVRARIVVVRADKYVVLASSSNPRRRSQATSRCVDS